MRLPGYLRVSRHHVYCFRRRVPRDLRHLLSFGELRCSLRTSDRRRAVQLARVVAFKTDFYFEHVRMSRKKDDREEAEFRAGLIATLTGGSLKIDYDPVKPGEKDEAERLMAEFHKRSAAAPAPVLAAESEGLTLSDLVKAFLSAAEIKRRGDKVATVRKDSDALRLFEEVVGGNMPVRLVNQSCAVAYARRLGELGPDGTAKRSDNTQNNMMGCVSKFSRWVHGARPECGHQRMNFEVLRVKVQTRPDEQRAAFTVDEVRSILSSPELAAFQHKAPHKFWMPLIAAYSGLRIEEIAQLDPQDDFRQEGGVAVMDVNDRGAKQLKSQTSRRLVPVHPVLVKLGLLDYVAALKQAGARTMFPKQKMRDGRLAKNPAKAVNRFIAETMKIPKTLHSFRHTVATILKQKRVEESVAAALLGHAHGGITYSRYGKDHLVEVLRHEAVLKIAYGWGPEADLR